MHILYIKGPKKVRLERCQNSDLLYKLYHKFWISFQSPIDRKDHHKMSQRDWLYSKINLAYPKLRNTPSLFHPK